jgi:exo-beta-1,3-glucanase (GH17 family)
MPFRAASASRFAAVLGLLAALCAAPASAQRDTNGVIKNPKPFKAICYSGYRQDQGPGFKEPSEAEVREDLKILAAYAHEIRIYGSGQGTHGHDFVPKICDELGLKLHLGIWVDDKYDEATNLRAVNDAIALAKAGHPSIKSVIVGNEFMFRVRNIDKRPVAPAEARLVNWIKKVQAEIPSSIEVTNADTWGDWMGNTDAVIDNIDYLIWHTHPWWENKAIDAVTAHMNDVHGKIRTRLGTKYKDKRELLGEVGWPSFANNGPAVGSPENMAKFFQYVHKWAWPQNFEYWAFASFDESWKGAEGAVGAHWGMWNINRTPKSVITGIATLWPRYMDWGSEASTTLSPARASREASASRFLRSRGLLILPADSRDVSGRRAPLLTP